MAKNTPKARVVEAEEEEGVMKVRPVTQEEVEEVVDTDGKGADGPNANAGAMEEADPKASWVNFACYTTVDPAPHVGRFDFIVELGITKLEEKKSYLIPRHVAEHLVDKKVGIIVE